MVVYVLTCWSLLTGVTVECGQYISLERCMRAGPYISRMTALEFNTLPMQWRCEEARR